MKSAEDQRDQAMQDTEIKVDEIRSGLLADMKALEAAHEDKVKELSDKNAHLAELNEDLQ